MEQLIYLYGLICAALQSNNCDLLLQVLSDASEALHPKYERRISLEYPWAAAAELMYYLGGFPLREEDLEEFINMSIVISYAKQAMIEDLQAGRNCEFEGVRFKNPALGMLLLHYRTNAESGSSALYKSKATYALLKLTSSCEKLLVMPFD